MKGARVELMDREPPLNARGEAARVLVIDDEPIIREVLQDILAREGYLTTLAPDAETGLQVLDQQEYDLVILDLMLPGLGGFEALREIKRRDPDGIVVMITAYGSVESAVQGMRMGAHDYLVKPFKNEDVLRTLSTGLRHRRLLDENRSLRRALEGRARFGELVGRSASMLELYRLIEQVAPSRSTVLVQGESGTGKELVAQAIHLKSGRPADAFVVVNSGSMPADLLESNLFGHVKGAFTGAIQSKKGLFEVANGGSIFFDEISTVKSEVQAKLLRVIQEKEFLPLGAVQSLQVDVRIIAATNIDLQELVMRGEFREDLYYRLNVINIKLPPLRERREDIPLLVDHFVAKYAAENGKVVHGVAPEALALLVEHPWQGNVRELENVIERAVVLSSSPVIGLDLLPETLQGDRARPLPGPIQMDGTMSFYETMERLEREIILETLKSVHGVQRRAAARLGLNPTTLNEKIKRLKIQYR
ncbi:MAG TPA: sigma-54 dependent transcriptional regulator [Candidatus Polarisedimenticolia bacterium]|jgi:DNA-binding NtrC family response regulator|nr:sigma-54 dependent transcriptional regulator [Candidatus Polarisedimenticolia bacterium]